MSDATVALAGAAVGALATGLTQTVLSRRDRAVEARAAARTLWSVAFQARKQVEVIRGLGRWGGYSGFQQYVDDWQAERKALARRLNDLDFHYVSDAFGVLEQLEYVRASADLEAPLAPNVSAMLPNAENALRKAGLILFPAGGTWFQKHRPSFLIERRQRKLEAGVELAYAAERELSSRDSGAPSPSETPSR